MEYYQQNFQRPRLIYPSMSHNRKPGCTAIAHQRQRHDGYETKAIYTTTNHWSWRINGLPIQWSRYRRGIAALKNNKAAGIDDVLVEQLNNLGSKTHKWLLAIRIHCFTQNKIPTIWRTSKIIAILKPGEDSAIPKSYRPISPSLPRVQRTPDQDLESHVHVNC